MIFNKSPQAIHDLEAHQARQIMKNDTAISRLKWAIPALQFQKTLYIVILGVIIPVESIAVFLANKMIFEGQNILITAGLSLQAVASIGALHVFKKIGNPQMDRVMQKMAWIAFLCFAIGFGIIASTTSLKEVMINLLPEPGTGGTSIDGSNLEETSAKGFDLNALNWIIPPAWYMAFSGLTLMLAFAAAEVLTKIMELHKKISEIRGRSETWGSNRSELKEVEEEIDLLDAQKKQCDANFRGMSEHAVNQIVAAYEEGLSYGPRKLVQTIRAQSLGADHRNSVYPSEGVFENLQIDVPQFEEDLKRAESSLDPNKIQNLIDTACKEHDGRDDNPKQLKFNFDDNDKE